MRKISFLVRQQGPALRSSETNSSKTGAWSTLKGLRDRKQNPRKHAYGDYYLQCAVDWQLSTSRQLLMKLKA